ncbi:hypothetical protein N7495_003737 [Penicillium taxi]|uniref:uncharacterized protein n=1 Tax=Penicillium taxi TaxID=168475 RepID=UPI0025455455|nr:uncharacterized protein N7495_003737 [Penicillium taxi]KAJ5898993.1 hypothetical protein N7495_003737 [Penicillium taxi]
MSTEEGTFTLPDGFQAYTKTWKPNGPPRAILVSIHGFSDHSNTSNDFFPLLTSQDIEVRSFDQRGWGRTVKNPKDRGDSGPTETVLGDLDSFLKNVFSTSGSTPVFLMGHSMGGGEVLTYILHPNSPWHKSNLKLAGVISNSAFVNLDKSSRPSKFIVVAGRFAGLLMPKFQRWTALDEGMLTRDEATNAEFAKDPLCHNYGTLEGLAGMLDRAIYLDTLQSHDGSIPPVLFAHGTADKLTSYPAAKRLADVIAKKGDVTFCSYEGAYHVLHAELPETREKFASDLIEWISNKSNKAKL